MVTAELLVAIESLDENEQRALAEALSRLDDSDEVGIDDAAKRLVGSRHEEMKSNPDLGFDFDETRARIGALLRR